VIDLYKQAVQGHKDRISSYQVSSDLRRYDNTISEYNSLQRLSDAIKTSSVFRDVDAPNYYTEVQRVKEEAAGAYYDAVAELGTNSRRSKAGLPVFSEILTICSWL
jgi:protein tyrosine/serine phosphatase